MKILAGEFGKGLDLSFASKIKAGFPSPVEDYMEESLDFNRDMIQHPEATFYGCVSGDSMIEAGISNGDIAVIDRSLDAADGDLVVAFVNGEFTMKFLDLSHRSKGYIELRPANKDFKPIRINDLDNFEIWGVVAFTIKRWHS